MGWRRVSQSNRLVFPIEQVGTDLYGLHEKKNSDLTKSDLNRFTDESPLEVHDGDLMAEGPTFPRPRAQPNTPDLVRVSGVMGRHSAEPHHRSRM